MQYLVHCCKMKSKTLCISLLTLFGLITAYRPIYSENYVLKITPNTLIWPEETHCDLNITPEIKTKFSAALYGFIVNVFKKTVLLSDAHSTFSPYTLWKTLAAIAEGSEGTTKHELYHLLGLPEDRCLRKMFYHLAASREYPSNDVILDRKRVIYADSSVTVNRQWEDFVKSQRLIDVSTASFKSNPSATLENWERNFDACLPALNLQGNSVILESLDYNGLFTYSFPENVIREPFYNVFGEKIGSLEFMRMRRRVRMALVPSLNLKVIEMPVGRDGRYKMLFGLFIDYRNFKMSLETLPFSVLFDTLKNMKKTQESIDIAIPRITLTTETDFKRVLEEFGVRSLWENPYGTSYISTPAALPSSFIQRVTVTLDSGGIRPSTEEFSNFVPALSRDRNATTHDFIANQPFMFGLCDSDTYTLLFATIFSKPY